MSSKRRIQSSRANGARSHGPKTPEGKSRVANNAVRHGLLASCLVLRNESLETFHDLFDSFVARFHPRDEVEFSLVEEMAACHWRMRRGWAFETELMNKAIGRQPYSQERPGEIPRMAAAFSELAEQPQLALLNRSETRLHRMFQRALHNLLLLRQPESSEKSAAATPEPEIAVESKGETAAPTAKTQNYETNPIPETDTPVSLPDGEHGATGLPSCPGPSSPTPVSDPEPRPRPAVPAGAFRYTDLTEVFR